MYREGDRGSGTWFSVQHLLWARIYPERCGAGVGGLGPKLSSLCVLSFTSFCQVCSASPVFSLQHLLKILAMRTFEVGIGMTSFWFLFQQWLLLWPWASYLISLDLCFFICKMERIWQKPFESKTENSWEALHLLEERCETAPRIWINEMPPLH